VPVIGQRHHQWQVTGTEQVGQRFRGVASEVDPRMAQPDQQLLLGHRAVLGEQSLEGGDDDRDRRGNLGSHRPNATRRRSRPPRETAAPVRGRFGRARTIHDTDALDRAWVSVSARTRALDDVAEGAGYGTSGANRREDQAVPRRRGPRYAPSCTAQGWADAALDLARERTSNAPSRNTADPDRFTIPASDRGMAGSTGRLPN
jgi:hypothetical protein